MAGNDIQFKIPEVYHFYIAMQQCLMDEFNLLLGMMRDTREDTRQILMERIMNGAANALGIAAGALFPGGGLLKPFMKILMNAVHEQVTHRKANKTTLAQHLVKCSEREKESYTFLLSHEAAVVWTPSILWLRDRLKRIGCNDTTIQNNFSFLGHIGAIRLFEFLLEYDDGAIKPSNVALALIKGKSGSGHQKLFDNALQYDIGLNKVRFTAEGFFGKVCYFYDHVLYVKNDYLDKENAGANTRDPTYGYAQLWSDFFLTEGHFTNDAHLEMRTLPGTASYCILKSPFRFITIQTIYSYLEDLRTTAPGNPILGLVDWLHNKFPQFYPREAQRNKEELLIPVFRGTIDGNMFPQLRQVTPNFTGVDFSYSAIKNLTIHSFHRSRLINCFLENVKVLSLSGTRLDQSTIINCDFSNIRLTEPLHLNCCQVFQTSFIGFQESLLAKLEFNETKFDAFTRNTVSDNSTLSQNDFCKESVQSIEAADKRQVTLSKVEIEEMKRSIENLYALREEEKKQEEERKEAAEMNRHQNEKKQLETNQAMEARVRYLEVQLAQRISPVNAPNFLNVQQILDEQRFNPNIWASLTNHLLISTKGEKGQNGDKGKNGNSAAGYGANGDHGEDGAPGQDGRNARDDIEVTMAAILDLKVLYVRDDHGAINPTLMTLTADTKIHLNASGGDGGHGGHGGHGGGGGRGKDGADATSYSKGEDGGNGGDGGSGGRPGQGGRGGDARRIRVRVDDTQSFLLAFIASAVAEGGAAGRNGEPGLGGRGGEGGIGGNDYSWTETVGSGENRYTVTRHNPGGRNGSQGRKGADASPLRSMIMSGAVGRVQYQLFDGNFTQARNFSNIFNPQLVSAVLVGSDDGIIEPGEMIMFSSLDVTNNSDMPTPKFGISVGANVDKIIRFNDSDRAMYRDSIINAARVTFPDLPASVYDGVPLGHRPYIEESNPSFSVYIEPVQVVMPKFDVDTRDKTKASFHSRFPIELSEPGYTQALVLGHCVPIHFKIRNISALDYGMKGAANREVFVSINAECGTITPDGLVFSNTTGSGFSLKASAVFKVMEIKSLSELHMSGAVKMLSPDIPLYSQVMLHLSLRITNINSSIEQRVIQQIDIPVQITELYQDNPSPELLLVINSNTSSACVTQWKVLAKKLGMTVSVYNISLYGYFDYFDTRFTNHLKDCIVIVFDNKFRHPLTAQMTNASSLINKHDPYRALLLHNVKTYLVQAEMNAWREWLQLVPYQESTAQYTSRSDFLAKHKPGGSLTSGVYRVNGNKTLLFSSPTAAMMTKKLTPFSQKLLKAYPERLFALATTFQEEKRGSKLLICTRYKIGEIIVVSGPKLTSTNLAVSEGDPTSDFMLFKLFSFEKKLTKLDTLSTNDPNLLNVMTNAIIADLSDEFTIFANSDKTSFTLDHVIQQLAHWQMFRKSLVHLNQSAIIVPYVRDVIFAMDWLITHAGGRPDVAKYYREWIDQELMQIYTSITTGSARASAFHAWKREQHQRLGLPANETFSLSEFCGCGGSAKILPGMTVGTTWKRVRNLSGEEAGSNCDNWYLMETKSCAFAAQAEQKNQMRVDINAMQLDNEGKIPVNSLSLLASESVFGKQTFFHLQSHPIVHIKDSNRTTVTVRAAPTAENSAQLIGLAL